MKKILILAVNYKSYDVLPSFVRSVDVAASMCPECKVTVSLCDNTDMGYQDIDIPVENISLRVLGYHENIGYLGGSCRMLADLRKEGGFDFDYMAVSNVDLEIAPDFFQKLIAIDTDGIGWLAPDIYTSSRDNHANPFMYSRPTLNSFRKWRALYACPVLYGLYERWAFHKSRGNKVPEVPVDMYAGHGAFMLFTRPFIEHYTNLEYPCFMYTEEIFLAELVRMIGLRVVYQPSLRICNIGSVSVALLGSAWKCRTTMKSLDTVCEMFFKDK